MDIAVRGQARQTDGFAMRSPRGMVDLCTASLLLAVFPLLGQTQTASASSSNRQSSAQAAPELGSGDQAGAAAKAREKDSSPKVPSNGDRRRAMRSFLEASKLFEREQFEEAFKSYRQAAVLDPSNKNYALAAELARSHAVTALIQTAAKDRIRGDAAGERGALERALVLDPRNIQVTEHLYELGGAAVPAESSTINEQEPDSIGEPIEVEPSRGLHSFHLHTDQRRAIQEVFKAFGLEVTLDDSVRLTQVHLDVDDASFKQAMRVVSLLTNTFYVALDAHRVLVAGDTPENRRQFERLELETIYLPGLTPAEMTEVSTLAKSVFELQQSTMDVSAGTFTVRAKPSTLDAFNGTIRGLIEGHNQVLLEVSLFEIAHTSERNTGVQPPQSISAFNVYAEEQSILNANQALVQQIISSGLAAPGDTLAILGILLASGQVSSSLFSSGFALFGGGITQSALSPGSVTANMNLNSSDTRALDHLLLRLSDGSGSSDTAAGTIRSGTRYPIQTASFSSLLSNTPNIPGLTGAGSSSSLSSLLSSFAGSAANVPQIEYQDLGLTLKATPKVMRNNEVALSIDMKIDALSGSSANGNPILNNRAYSGVVTLREGEGVVLVSDIDKQESRAISGVPGLSEIPGFNNLTESDKQRDYATLLILITPHLIRETQASGHTPMVRIERATALR